jgi:uncharacterized membrane protein
MKPAKLLGHHIHPMLIVFPLGLLAVSVFFDIAHLWTRETTFTEIAYWNILAGVLGGLLAAVFGFWDWLTISSGTRAKRIGAWHGITNVVVVTLFAASWLMRRSDPMHLPSTTAQALSFVAVVLALVGGWLGGELVEKLGIGVAPDAGPNAPSSLQGEPLPEARHGVPGRTS